MREPVPCPSASRGRIPPAPPTAVGLMERPEWGLPHEEPRAPWWGRLLAALICLVALVGSLFVRRTHYDDYYAPRFYGRVPVNFPQDPEADRQALPGAHPRPVRPPRRGAGSPGAG